MFGIVLRIVLNIIFVTNENIDRYYMKKALSRLLSIGLLISGLVAGGQFLSSCKGVKSKIWADAADSCTFVLVDRFMDKQTGIFKGSAGNVLDNSQWMYWQQAHSENVIIEAYTRLKDSDPERAQEYRVYMERWIENKANNWWSDNCNGFYNQFTDDMAWIAITLLNMSEATGEKKYFDLAAEVYDYMVEDIRVVEDEKGWGLCWRLVVDENPTEEYVAQSIARHACTVVPAGVIACKLYNALGKDIYLEQAIKVYDYMRQHGGADDNGSVGEPPLTYTQGAWIEMCRLLFHITGEQKYFDDAVKCAEFTMQANGRCTIAGYDDGNGNGILRDEGSTEDNSFFKAALIPNVIDLAMDSVTPQALRERIVQFLTYNAETMWSNVDRSLWPAMYVNYDWTKVYDAVVEKDGKTYVRPGSLGAQTSGASLLEGMARLEREGMLKK